MNYYDHFLGLSTVYVCVILLSVLVQGRKFLLLDKELKGKIVLKKSMQYEDSSQFLRYL